MSSRDPVSLVVPDDFGDSDMVGTFLYHLAQDLWPINRSLSGPGVRQTLAILQNYLPDLKIHSVPSGTKVFDWDVPDEWSVTEAWLEDEAGRRIVDFADNNLHLVGYSTPVDVWLSFDDLSPHLYSRPDMPDAIPYVTSYYSRHWGFCLSENQHRQLDPSLRYHAKICSVLAPGHLNYADLVIPGRTTREILLSTYICHPSMANNELSGPVVATALALWLQTQPQSDYSYRFVFIPETIGSIVYLSQHREHLCTYVDAGYVVTCVGDERAYSFLPSRQGDSLSDRVARHVLDHMGINYQSYSFLDRGSDERQYCSPHIDLPVCSIMRSKYGTYPEYHTSLDNLDFISPKGLSESFFIYQRILDYFSVHCHPVVTVPCEPQLGKRGLFPAVSTFDSWTVVCAMLDFLAYADGMKSLLDIANVINRPFWELTPLLRTLTEAGLVVLEPITAVGRDCPGVAASLRAEADPWQTHPAAATGPGCPTAPRH